MPSIKQSEIKVWQNTFKTWCSQDQYSVLIIVNLESNMCIASSPVYTVNMVKIKEILKKNTCIFLQNCDNFRWSNERNHIYGSWRFSTWLKMWRRRQISGQRMIYLGAMETYVVTKLSRVGNNLRLYIFVCYLSWKDIFASPIREKYFVILQKLIIYFYTIME